MLSIFIPSYNHARYVTDAIDSARLIDIPDKHIFVIDDASVDNSVQVIEDHLGKINADNVTFIKKEKNLGVIDSTIAFLNLCKTEYIYLIASDDIAIPSGISKLVERLNGDLSLQFIIGGGKNLMPDGGVAPIYGRRHADLFSQPRERFAQTIFLMESSPLLCQSTVFRTSALRVTDAVTADLSADDYAIFSKLFLHFNRRGIDYDFLPEIDCVRYRHHGDNSYRNIVRQVTAAVEVIEAVAPKPIRNRAVAYKLAFHALVAIRRGDISSAQKIMRMIRLRHARWIIPGLVMNAYWWRKYR